jgi:hypothetical protein
MTIKSIKKYTDENKKTAFITNTYLGEEEAV